MSRTWKWILSGLAVVVVACVIVVLWPAGDPLAGVDSVAVAPPDWSADPQGAAVRGPFLKGLEITLEDRSPSSDRPNTFEPAQLENMPSGISGSEPGDVRMRGANAFALGSSA